MAESAEPLTDSTALALTADPAKMLTELTTAANLQYSLKNYTAAADLYSEATELQATLNGELAPENAELLYLYGRCLYHVAVANSDVLGGKVAGEKKEKSDTKTNGEGRSNSALPDADQKLAEVVEAAVESKEGMKQSAAEQPSVEDKPYFQFTGDENWDTESDDADDEEGAEDADNDDFANAYEVLELARVLNTRRLDALEHEDQANESTARTGPILRSVRIAQLLASHRGAAVRALMERLADIHDLQGEINLENEKFSYAIPDFREALDMKMAIHRPESALIAEAHFKLSLALEFASMMAVREAQNADSDDTAAADPPEVDKHMREEAAEHMDSAIASCRARVAKEEAELQNLDGVLAAEKTKSINDVKEMIQDMLTRVRYCHHSHSIKFNDGCEPSWCCVQRLHRILYLFCGILELELGICSGFVIKTLPRAGFPYTARRFYPYADSINISCTVANMI